MYKIRIDMPTAVGKLEDLPKQARFAAIVALTRMAKRGQDDVKEEMKESFDNPTRWVLNSTRVRPATKASPYAELLIKDSSYSGRPVTGVVAPNVYGGTRAPKAFEKALMQMGVMGRGQYAVPGDGAKRNANGNMSRAEIARILRDLKSGKGPYFASDGTGKTSHLPPGVWVRTSHSIKPVLIFVGKAQYSRIMDFFGAAKKAMDKYYKEEYDKAYSEAVRTAK